MSYVMMTIASCNANATLGEGLHDDNCETARHASAA